MKKNNKKVEKSDCNKNKKEEEKSHCHDKTIDHEGVTSANVEGRSVINKLKKIWF